MEASLVLLLLRRRVSLPALVGAERRAATQAARRRSRAVLRPRLHDEVRRGALPALHARRSSQLASPRCRARLVQDWRAWLGAAGARGRVVRAVVHLRAGPGSDRSCGKRSSASTCCRRFTGFLDPTHVHPWNYYLHDDVAGVRAPAGAVAGGRRLHHAAGAGVRRRWLEGAVVLMWAIVPMAIISAGTSKLYHYAYPFLPPLAIAGGYRRVAGRDAGARAAPTGARAESRTPLTSVAAASKSGHAAVCCASGGLFSSCWRRPRQSRRRRWADCASTSTDTTLLSNSGVLRPVLLIVVVALGTRTSARVGRLVVALLVLNAMPLAAYREQLEAAARRASTRCARPPNACSGCSAESGAGAGLFVDVPEGNLASALLLLSSRAAARPRDNSVRSGHRPLPAAIRPRPRPILMSDVTWREYLERRARRILRPVGAPELSPPMVSFLNTVLLLPGPYVACSSEAGLRAR